MQYYFRDYETELGLDNEDLFNNVLEDLYNAETFMNRKFRAVNLSFGSNRTTTSTTPVLLTGSIFQHTFTYPNARITLFNLAIVNSGTANLTRAKIDVEGETPDQEGFASNGGVTQRSMQAESTYENLPVGVELDISTFWFVTGGTGTAAANSELIYMIEEWD